MILALTMLACLPNLCDQVDALPGGPDSQVAPQDLVGGVLAIGDSILATNGNSCQTVPDHAALDLKRWVDNRSVGGKRLTHPDGDADIQGQLLPGDWDWVVMTGGANDLVKECDCPKNGASQACLDVLDQLALPDALTGDIYDTIALIDEQSPDAYVLVLGYYPFPDDAAFDYDRCNALLQTLDDRYARVADQLDRVVFVSTTQVMDLDAYPDRIAWDNIHPSGKGAEALGELVARTIRDHRD